MGNDIRSNNKVELPAREHLLQLLQILRAAGIDGQLVGEQVHVELVRDAHVDDLPADEMRLCPLGPGEFVHGQIHFESHVSDHLRDALVGQSEWVEGAREEGHLAAGLDFQLPLQQAVLGDEAVQAGEAGRAVEVGQLVPGVLIQLEADLPESRLENIFLFLTGQEL